MIYKLNLKILTVEFKGNRVSIKTNRILTNQSDKIGILILLLRFQIPAC